MYDALDVADLQVLPATDETVSLGYGQGGDGGNCLLTYCNVIATQCNVIALTVN